MSFGAKITKKMSSEHSFLFWIYSSAIKHLYFWSLYFGAIGNLGKNRQNETLPMFNFQHIYTVAHMYFWKYECSKIKMHKQVLHFQPPNFEAAAIQCFTEYNALYIPLLSIVHIALLMSVHHSSWSTCKTWSPLHHRIHYYPHPRSSQPTVVVIDALSFLSVSKNNLN